MAKVDDETLVAFADGELDDVTAGAVEKAIADDPVAREKLRLMRRSAVLVRGVYRDHDFGRLDPRADASLARLSPAGRPAVTRPRFVGAANAAAGCAARGIGAGFALGRYAPAGDDLDEDLCEDIADYHIVYAREDEHQVEMSADRRADIEDWLGERLHRKLRIPDLSRHGLTFRGARLLGIADRPVADLMYRWPELDHSPLGLCICDAAPENSPLKPDHRDGVNMVLWHRDRFVYVLVGWADMDFLKALAGELMPELAV